MLAPHFVPSFLVFESQMWFGLALWCLTGGLTMGHHLSSPSSNSLGPQVPQTLKCSLLLQVPHHNHHQNHEQWLDGLAPSTGAPPTNSSAQAVIQSHIIVALDSIICFDSFGLGDQLCFCSFSFPSFYLFSRFSAPPATFHFI